VTFCKKKLDAFPLLLFPVVPPREILLKNYYKIYMKPLKVAYSLMLIH